MARKKQTTHAPDAFYLFPRLPTELRWMIWEMAICTDKTPRIHHYNLFNRDMKQDHQLQSNLQEMLRAFPPPRKPLHPCNWSNGGKLETIFRPRLESYPSQFGWAEANRFVYLWDSGLKTACKESRAAVLRSEGLQHDPNAAIKPIEMTVAACHKRQERFYMDIRPGRDIIWYHFAPEDVAACASLDWGVLLTRLPFYRLPRTLDMNIAFEFHDSWIEGFDSWIEGFGSRQYSVIRCLSEASDRGLVMRLYWSWLWGEIPRWTRLWLIDRSGRFPRKWQLSQRRDLRYEYEDLYDIEEYQSRPKPKYHRIFVDGKNKFVECDRYTRQYGHLKETFENLTVPILRFVIWVEAFCKPDDSRLEHELNHTRNCPVPGEKFIRVLRQLPGKRGKVMPSLEAS